jgi:hypothetical protein
MRGIHGCTPSSCQPDRRLPLQLHSPLTHPSRPVNFGRFVESRARPVPTPSYSPISIRCSPAEATSCLAEVRGRVRSPTKLSLLTCETASTRPTPATALQTDRIDAPCKSRSCPEPRPWALSASCLQLAVRGLSPKIRGCWPSPCPICLHMPVPRLCDFFQVTCLDDVPSSVSYSVRSLTPSAR